MPHTPDPPAALEVLTADYLATLDERGTYTPVLTASTTNPNLGADGSAAGWYHRTGHMISGTARFHFDGSGASPGTGFWLVSLPFPADTSIMGASTSNNADTDPVGHGRVRLVSPTSGSRLVFCWLASASQLVMIADGTNSRIEGGDGAYNRLWVKFSYIADPAGLP